MDAWILIGILVLCDILFAVAINRNTYLTRKHLKKLIEVQATEANQKILLAHIAFADYPLRKWGKWLLITPLTVCLLVFLALMGETQSGAVAVIGLPFVMLVMTHFIIGLMSIFSIVFSFLERRRNSLQLRDFMNRNEVELLIEVNKGVAEERGGDGVLFVEKFHDRFERDVLSWKVLLPDELVGFLIQKESLVPYIELQKKMKKMQEIDKSLLTLEQFNGNARLEADFKERLKTLLPLLEIIEKATSPNYQQEVDKNKLDKGLIQRAYSQQQAEVERELNALANGLTGCENPESNHFTLPEAIRDLQRITQSEQVSKQLKTEASGLIQKIIEQSTIEKQAHEKEMADMDALAVIKSSKLHYAIAEIGLDNQ